MSAPSPKETLERLIGCNRHSSMIATAWGWDSGEEGCGCGCGKYHARSLLVDKACSEGKGSRRGAATAKAGVWCLLTRESQRIVANSWNPSAAIRVSPRSGIKSRPAVSKSPSVVSMHSKR